MILVTLLYTCQGFTQEKPQGIYAGLEKKYKSDSIGSGTDTYTPKKYQWFNLSYISFRGDSVFLEQIPVYVYKRDTIFSASEDGVFSYSGILSIDGATLKAELELNDCDTCPMRMINFTPAKGAAEDAESLPVNTDEDLIRKEESKARNRFKHLTIKKVPKSKNLIINGSTYRPQ